MKTRSTRDERGAGSSPACGVCPCRLMEKPNGYEPFIVSSNLAGDTVTVADLVMQQIMDLPYAGSNPVGHLQGE